MLDYGKPVQVDVLANDTLYGTSRTMGGIRVHAEDKAESFTEDQDLALTNGAAKIAENKVEYTPDKFMDSIDRLVMWWEMRTVPPTPMQLPYP